MPDQTAIIIQKLAQAFGIHNTHAIHSKELLIRMVNTKYAALTRPLKIGPPIKYDSEEYFELSIIRDVYSDYPVEFKFCSEK